MSLLPQEASTMEDIQADFCEHLESADWDSARRCAFRMFEFSEKDGKELLLELIRAKKDHELALDFTTEL